MAYLDKEFNDLLMLKDHIFIGHVSAPSVDVEHRCFCQYNPMFNTYGNVWIKTHISHTHTPINRNS
jgi:hypothetical protein